MTKRKSQKQPEETTYAQNGSKKKKIPLIYHEKYYKPEKMRKHL